MIYKTLQKNRDWATEPHKNRDARKKKHFLAY
jgi:hypothetical protein